MRAGVCFSLARMLGAMLRSARYARVRIVNEDGRPVVRKQRSLLAPLLVRLADPVHRMLDTGVHVLAQADWEVRERRLYGDLYGAAIRCEANGALVLPCFPGATLASLLEDPVQEPSVRTRAIELAVGALAGLHRMGITHGDAMAENVMVDLAAGIARWFDFESVHEPGRPMTWRRADDVRALLATCLLRTAPLERAGTLDLILDVYADDRLTGVLADSFASPMRPALIFHLGQAGLSLGGFREIGWLLRGRREVSAGA